MRGLIIKLGATGDVVRTTTLLHVLNSDVDWVTADNNAVLLNNIPGVTRCIPWGRSESLHNLEYDFVINLEDTVDAAALLRHISYGDLYGSYLDEDDNLVYTENSRDWFDLSLISRFGKEKADQLKLENRRSYQELVFKGLGHTFDDEPYILPTTTPGDLTGDIAIASQCGPVWPMKNWAYFDEISSLLLRDGFTVNHLPQRPTLIEHIADINGHRYLISGDSLPMHIAIGLNKPCLTFFTCTSPWEIHDYGVQTQLVSPHLDRYFYDRGYHPEATTSIALEDAYRAVSGYFENAD